VDDSFNCISVEGHMSTNDTVLLLASGAAGERVQGSGFGVQMGQGTSPLTTHDSPLTAGDLAKFQSALNELCVELARQIPDDGEGASHLIVLEVRGCKTKDDARRIARTIADSALVKTAIAGGDPNWGRI